MTFRILQKEGLIPPDERNISRFEIEGIFLESKGTNESLPTSVTEEERLNGSVTVTEIINYKQRDANFTEDGNSQIGSEGMTKEKDCTLTKPSNKIKPSVLNENCESSDDKNDAVLEKVEKSMLSEEMLFEGKYPAWLA